MGLLKSFIIALGLLSYLTASDLAAPTIRYHDVELEYRKAAERYSVDAHLFKALLTVESNLNHTAVNADTLDFGIAQINYRTAEAYDIDTTRLTHDRAYSIDRGAFILSTFKKYNKRGPASNDWVCLYNVGPGKLVGRKADNCSKYLIKIRNVYQMYGYTMGGL